MKTALIIGASGLIGSSLLKQLIATDDYAEIRIFVRKELQISSLKVKQIKVDFDNLLLEDFQNVDDVFCCLGTTIKKAGSKEAFRKVDFDYPYNTAKMALSAGCKQFMIVTAMGASTKSMVFYNQVKGEIEDALAKMPFEAVLVFRPSLLLGDRAEARFGEQFATVFMKAIDFMTPAKYKAIHVDQVAKAMHKKAQEQVKGFHVFENDILLES
jgi:uncharacterized protein YbjT (DUF2867 family)